MERLALDSVVPTLIFTVSTNSGAAWPRSKSTRLESSGCRCEGPVLELGERFLEVIVIHPIHFDEQDLLLFWNVLHAVELFLGVGHSIADSGNTLVEIVQVFRVLGHNPVALSDGGKIYRFSEVVPSCQVDLDEMDFCFG